MHRPGRRVQLDATVEQVGLEGLLVDPAGRWEVPSGAVSGRIWVNSPAAPRGKVGNDRGFAGVAIGDAERDDTPARVAWDLQLAQAHFSSRSGAYAGEGLGGITQGEFVFTGGKVLGAGEITLTAGEVVASAIYIDASANPVSAGIEASYQEAREILEFRGNLDHRGVVRGTVLGIVAMGGGARLRALEVTIAELFPEHAIAGYLQGFAAGTPFESIDAQGKVRAQISWYEEAGASVRLQLDAVGVEDSDGRFAVSGVNGEIVWTDQERERVRARTKFSWEGGSLLEVPLGAGRFVGSLWGRQLSLDEVVGIPLFDGRVNIRELSANGLGTDALSWRVDAVLEPISMEAVTEVFGWPSFGGTVSGALPGMRFHDHTLTLDGALAVQLLGGEILITNLTLEEPFGVVPRLGADATVRALSLEALTEAFSFGRILGRLDGDVQGLEMVDWDVTSFDAHFFTPADDDSVPRISQRAVDNLAQLGGGPSTLLSTTFLRFFEEFSYRDLGVSCRLQDGVCEMGGIAEDSAGYFIVRGRGIPQINVKGYNRRVDWSALTERLLSAVNSAGPTIQ